MNVLDVEGSIGNNRRRCSRGVKSAQIQLYGVTIPFRTQGYAYIEHNIGQALCS